MSTLKVNDIAEATSGGSKVFMVRAWFNYKNSGGNSLLEDGGVSSVTDTGTGTYRAAFDIAFTNVNYASAGSCNPQHPPWLSIHQTVQIQTPQRSVGLLVRT